MIYKVQYILNQDLVIQFLNVSSRIVKQILAPKGVSCLDISRNGTSLCVGTIDGYLVSYDLRSIQLNEPVNECRMHDTAVNCVEYLHGDVVADFSSSSNALNYMTSHNSMSSSANTHSISIIDQINKQTNSHLSNSNHYCGFANFPLKLLFIVAFRKINTRPWASIRLRTANMLNPWPSRSHHQASFIITGKRIICRPQFRTQEAMRQLL